MVNYRLECGAYHLSFTTHTQFFVQRFLPCRNHNRRYIFCTFSLLAEQLQITGQCYCQNRPPSLLNCSLTSQISNSTALLYSVVLNLFYPHLSPPFPPVHLLIYQPALDSYIIVALTQGSTRQPEDLLLEIEPVTKWCFLSPTPYSPSNVAYRTITSTLKAFALLNDIYPFKM